MQPISYSPAMTYGQPRAQHQLKTTFGSLATAPKTIDKTQAYGQARELVQDAAHAIWNDEAPTTNKLKPQEITYTGTDGTVVEFKNDFSCAYLKVSQPNKNVTVTFETSGPQLPTVKDLSGFIHSSDGSCIASTNNDRGKDFPFNKANYQGLIDLINDKNPEVIKASKAVRHPSHRTNVQKALWQLGEVTGFNAWWNG